MQHRLFAVLCTFALMLPATFVHADECPGAIQAMNKNITDSANRMNKATVQTVFGSDQNRCDEYKLEIAEDERTLDLSRTASRVCGPRLKVQCDDNCKLANLAKLRKTADDACATAAAVAAGVAPPGTKWAALNPNSEMTSKVAWAATEDVASSAASLACEKISKTCSSRPSVTSNLDGYFITACCLNPSLGCATNADADIGHGTDQVMQTLTKANYSACSVKQVLSARTGKSPAN